MRSVSLFLLSFLVALSQMTQVPILSAAKRKHVLDVIARALEEEDPAVRQALVTSIGFPHMPYQHGGMARHGHIIFFTGTVLLLINLFSLYVIFLWLVYVFQKRGIRQRYQRWSEARDLRLEQEEFLFRQGPDKKNRLKEDTEEKFDKDE